MSWFLCVRRLWSVCITCVVSHLTYRVSCILSNLSSHGPAGEMRFTSIQLPSNTSRQDSQDIAIIFHSTPDFTVFFNQIDEALMSIRDFTQKHKKNKFWKVLYILCFPQTCIYYYFCILSLGFWNASCRPEARWGPRSLCTAGKRCVWYPSDEYSLCPLCLLYMDVYDGNGSVFSRLRWVNVCVWFRRWWWQVQDILKLSQTGLSRSCFWMEFERRWCGNLTHIHLHRYCSSLKYTGDNILFLIMNQLTKLLDYLAHLISFSLVETFW